MRLRGTVALALSLLVIGVPSASAAVVDRDGALRVATANPRVTAVIDRYGNGHASVDYQDGKWVVTIAFGGRVRAQALVDRFSGRVTAVYTGTKAEFPLARGSGSGVVQRKLGSLWAWVPLSLLFVFAFFDPRRPWRLLHLDLAVVVLFGISYAFFMKGNLSASVPLSYPPLVYLLVRSLLAGFRPRGRAGPLTRLPLRWLAGLTLGLLAARLVLMFADTFVLDVGYASTAGAQRVLDGLQLYTRGGNHFDTYGPLAYLGYIPFILLWPFHESQTYPPAAQAAAIFFDLATVAGLYVLGRGLRSAALGWALALAWVACPFTALSLVCGSNDAMVSAFLVWAMVGLRSGALSGLLTGAAAAAKLTPALLLPVIARGGGALTLRRATIAVGAAVAVFAVALLPVMPDGGLREFYDTTIGFQLHRLSPFSIWTQHPGWHALQTVLKAAALVLAVAVAFVPRGERTVGQVAALGSAVLVAEQVPLQHWFYLYLVWSLPLYCVALFTEHEAGAQPAASQP